MLYAVFSMRLGTRLLHQGNSLRLANQHTHVVGKAISDYEMPRTFYYRFIWQCPTVRQMCL